MGAPKNFYNAVDQAKLGIDQIPGMVKDIADIKEDISKITPLPDVTSSDNNKILEVIDGVWSKGSKETYVDINIDTSTNVVTFVDSSMTYSKLAALLHNGKNAILRRVRSGGMSSDYTYYVPSQRVSSSYNNFMYFERVQPIYNESADDFTDIRFEIVVFTGSNTGKLIKVSNGICKTTLYTGDTLANTLPLSDSVLNYSALLISFKASDPITHQPILDSRLYNVDDLVIGVKFSKYDNDSNYISYTVSSDDEFTLADQAGSNWMVSRIVGIK